MLHTERPAESRDVERRVEVHERLLDAVVRRPDHRDLLVVAREVLGCEVALLDEGDRVVAATVDGEPAVVSGPCPWLPGDGLLVELVRRAMSAERARTAGDDEPVTVAAVLAGGRHLGAVVARGALAAEGRWALERVGRFAAVLGLVAKSSQDAERRLHAEVLDDLVLGHTGDPERLRRSLARFGLHPADPMWLLLVEDASACLEHALQAATRGRPGLLAHHERHWCLVTVDPDLVDSIRGALAGEGIPVRIGFAGPVRELGRMADAHRRALMALTSLQALQREGVADGGQLAAIAAVVEAADDRHPLFASLQPLMDHDARHGSRLMLTAWTHLEADRSVTLTARGLFIHRNTVRQRLQRIASVLGDGWDEGARRLETHLGLWIWRMRVGD